ncbi:MAG: DUF5723 family protein, partial [Longimicrobiales bacterium]
MQPKMIARAVLPFVLLAAALPASAQIPVSARASGIGASYIGLARGVDALFFNPANLALGNNPGWSFAIPVSIGASTSGLVVKDFRDVIDSDKLTDAEKAAIVNKVPGTGVKGELIAWPSIALQLGHLAFGVTGGIQGDQFLGKDLVDLAINGYQDNRYDYAVGNTVGTRSQFLDAAVAYSRNISKFSVGATGHYYMGRSLARSKLFEPRYNVQAGDINVDYVEVFSGGGNGYGLDIGAAIQASSKLTLSGAVANVITKMSWDEDLSVRQVSLTKATFDNFDIKVINDDLKASETKLDPSNVSLEAYDAALGLYDEAYFPSRMRLGAALTPWSTGRITAGYES